MLHKYVINIINLKNAEILPFLIFALLSELFLITEKNRLYSFDIISHDACFSCSKFRSETSVTSLPYFCISCHPLA
jgi:hypothetical protein